MKENLNEIVIIIVGFIIRYIEKKIIKKRIQKLESENEYLNSRKYVDK